MIQSRSDPIARSYVLGCVWRKKDDQDRHWLHLAMERVRALDSNVEASRDPWYAQQR